MKEQKKKNDAPFGALYPYDAMFSPVRCGSLTLKNRVIMVSGAHCLSRIKLEHYYACAAGGAGLIIADDIPTGHWQEFARNIHLRDSRIFIKLRVSPSGMKAALRDIKKALLAGMDGVCLVTGERYAAHAARWFKRERQHFGVRLVREIRKIAGANFPIMYCLSSQIFSAKAGGLADALVYMGDLVRSGADAFTIVSPDGASQKSCRTSREYFVSLGLKSNLGANVPFAAVYSNAYPDLAEKALREKDCDMLMLSYPLLADPDWCRKAYAGRFEDIRPCMNCREGFESCAVNADEFEPLLHKAVKPKRIALVGGGFAGMNFALYALARGHKVDLFADELPGGRLAAACRPAANCNTRNYVRWLAAKCEVDKNFNQRSGVTITPALIRRGRYAAVVCAEDAKVTCALEIPGWGGIPSLPARELMTHPELFPERSGNKVIIIGADPLGLDCARWLRDEHNCRVIVIASSRCPEIKGIKFISRAEPLRVSENRLFVRIELESSNVSKFLSRFKLKKSLRETVVCDLDCDLIVLTAEDRSDLSLYTEMLAKHAAPEIYHISPSLSPADANRAAYILARNI